MRIYLSESVGPECIPERVSQGLGVSIMLSFWKMQRNEKTARDRLRAIIHKRTKSKRAR